MSVILGVMGRRKAELKEGEQGEETAEEDGGEEFEGVFHGAESYESGAGS